MKAPTLTLDDVSRFIASTWKTDDEAFEKQASIAALGLTGEAGEVVEHIKKWLRDGKPIDQKEFPLELFDVLYYVFTNARLHGFDMQDILRAGAEKLNKRRVKHGKAELQLTATGVVL